VIERREGRKSLAMDASVKAAQHRQTVSIANLAPSGCMISGVGVQLALEQRIVLRPEGLEALTGVVRWSSNGRAGIAFDMPLHPAVVDHLCRQHPEGAGSIFLDLAA
jgi:hypothetical protein